MPRDWLRRLRNLEERTADLYGELRLGGGRAPLRVGPLDRWDALQAQLAGESHWLLTEILDFLADTDKIPEDAEDFIRVVSMFCRGGEEEE
jgi:hypothetical protein